MRKMKADTCPDCGDKVPAEAVDRRSFLRTTATAAGVAALSGLPSWGRSSRKGAEDLIKELHAGLTDEQKKSVMMPYENEARLKVFNKALGKTLAESYTKPQIELVERILRAISSDEAGWNQVSRAGTWDASKAFENCGANIFGDPTSGKYAWVFTGHHITFRCDGNTEEGPAFGGPIYYGHTPNGYSDKNVFFPQTKVALDVFDALSAAQRKQAVVMGTPGEGVTSVKFRAAGEALPGLSCGELNAEQKGLVEEVMRGLLSPYRKEDGDEVMTIVKAKGGLEKLSLAFYKENEEASAKQPWHFWRLEGPGFVWNFRVLPHVHTFVNISSKA